MIRAGIPQPAWKRPLPATIEVCRAAHLNQSAGRFHVAMTLDDVPSTLLRQGPDLRREFEKWGHCPNAKPGMWQEIVDAAALERKIKDAALAMSGPFSAGDVKKIVGADVNVTPVLTDLTRQELLVRSGEKKGTRYVVSPPPLCWGAA